VAKEQALDVSRSRSLSKFAYILLLEIERQSQQKGLLKPGMITTDTDTITMLSYHGIEELCEKINDQAVEIIK